MRPETPAVAGVLYLVATPIGNLGDFGARAIEVLKSVQLIACEDTRHSRSLLDHYGIDRPLVALHEHNEDKVSERLLERLLAGASVGLIADAGTPLINDPGFPLVRLARQAGIRVSPIPGPCALIAALCASGLPSHRFAFEGFPPRKSAARLALFEALRHESRTLIFYESAHRVVATLRDAAAVLPAERRLVIGRELTKHFETLVETRLDQAAALLEIDADMRRGEFVLVIEGAAQGCEASGVTPEQGRILQILLREHSVKTAVALTVEITGAGRAGVYREALRLSAETAA